MKSLPFFCTDVKQVSVDVGMSRMVLCFAVLFSTSVHVLCLSGMFQPFNTYQQRSDRLLIALSPYRGDGLSRLWQEISVV